MKFYLQKSFIHKQWFLSFTFLSRIIFTIVDTIPIPKLKENIPEKIQSYLRIAINPPFSQDSK